MVEHAKGQGVDVRTVSLIAVGLLACLFAVVFVFAILFRNLVSLSTPAPEKFPSPSVFTDERSQRLDLEKAQSDRLAGKNGGIPIEQAMRMIAGRGANGYDPIMEAKP